MSQTSDESEGLTISKLDLQGKPSSIQVPLTPEGSEKEAPMLVAVSIQGSVKSVTILTKTKLESVSDNDSLLQAKLNAGEFDEEAFYIRVEASDLQDNPRIELPEAVKVDELLIILKEPLDESANEYTGVKLGVFACFEPAVSTSTSEATPRPSTSPATTGKTTSIPTGTSPTVSTPGKTTTGVPTAPTVSATAEPPITPTLSTWN